MNARALAMVNTAIWAISIIALVFVIQRAPSAKGLFVILAGGTVISVSLLSTLGKARWIWRTSQGLGWFVRVTPCGVTHPRGARSARRRLRATVDPG